MSPVVDAKWVWIALDLTGAESERAWSLTLKCGHTVFRRVAWRGVADPDKKAAPTRVTCELCAGKTAKYRLCADVEREHYERLHKKYRKSTTVVKWVPARYRKTKKTRAK